jgi:predicted  nucleic acid-binding Zn-ribbon protein
MCKCISAANQTLTNRIEKADLSQVNKLDSLKKKLSQLHKRNLELENELREVRGRMQGLEKGNQPP